MNGTSPHPVATDQREFHPIFKLSICIATYNRADLIRETLDSICAQLTDECEVVISDNASTDNTSDVVSYYANRFCRVSYHRNEENIGMDRNFDRAISLSHGEYSWLMTDDDILMPDAIGTVLSAIHSTDYSLVIVNCERRSFDLSRVLVPRLYEVSGNRTYRPEDMDRLAIDSVGLVTACCVVIRRAIWLSRNKEIYFGTLFAHVGVIFQRPLPGHALMIASPLVIFRDGHTRSFWSEFFEIMMIRWPKLVWSFPLGIDAKERIAPKKPWKDLNLLFLFRGAGWYTIDEYRTFVRPRLSARTEGILPKLVAVLPGRVLNTLLLLYFPITNARYGRLYVQFLQLSPFYIGRRFGRKRGLRLKSADGTATFH